MRCSSVGQWNTRREWHPRHPDEEKEAKKEECIPKVVGIKQRNVSVVPKMAAGGASAGAAQQQHRTYANSYDIGFIFAALHKKRYFDDEGNRIQATRLTAEQVRIPETVVYKAGFPVQWYFHSKVDGRFCKKKTQNIVIPQIFEVFSAENGTCDTRVVAVFCGTVDEGDPVNQVVYFDRKTLKDFIFAENVMKDGFLQRFVAPGEVLFDSAARNTTLHAIWSRYNCNVEQRVNKIKLNDKRESMVQKVNLSVSRTQPISVNPTSMLQSNIDKVCLNIAKHIRATSYDRAEVTNITAYFKIGEKNKLFMLFASSVTVAPKYQDAYGYIPSLKTFTGRHSPMINCPDFLPTGDTEAKTKNQRSNCSMCNCSHKDDEESCRYSITYKMLASYIEKERHRLRKEIMPSMIHETSPAQSPLNIVGDRFDESDISAKASAIFTLLDTDYDNAIPIVELWSGLDELGYEAREISSMLRLQHKMCKIKGEPSQEDKEEALKHRSPRPKTSSPSSGSFKVAQGSQAATIMEATSTSPSSPEVPALVTYEQSGALDEEMAGLEMICGAGMEIMCTSGGDVAGNEGVGTQRDALPGDLNLIFEVKKHFPIVTLDDFRKGVEKATKIMSQDRRRRFAANVDMYGSLPEELGDEGTENWQGKSSSLANSKEAKEKEAAGQVLLKHLPPFLKHLKKGLTANYLRRIVLSEAITEDFGSKKIWVCKSCSAVYNVTAGQTFQWRDAKIIKEGMGKQRKVIAVLKDIKEKSRLDVDFYFVGEIPDLCTPKMYEALHDHIDRSYVIGPPQFTPGYLKNLLAESPRRGHKLPNEYRRGIPLSLKQIQIKDKVEDDADMTNLMQRLGLTPRGPVRGTLSKHSGRTQSYPGLGKPQEKRPSKTADGGLRSWPKPVLSHERLNSQLNAVETRRVEDKKPFGFLIAQAKDHGSILNDSIIDFE